MLKEVKPGLFVDDVYTGSLGVQELNISFIPGEDRSLMVDTGLPYSVAPACREAIIEDVEKLGLDWKKLDCIITHSHRDHVGNAAFLNEMGSRVLVNPLDMRYTEDMIHHEVLHPDLRRKLFHQLGIEMSAPEVVDEFWRAADRFTAGFEDCWKFTWEPLTAGETVHYGDYTLETLALPGHSIGQMGLWDREKKILFSADQVVFGLAPLVAETGRYPSALEDYLQSMRTVKKLCGDCLFIPGHGEPFVDPAAQVDRIVGSYLEKSSVMYEVLRKSDKPLCTWGVASRSYGGYGKKMTDAQRVSYILILYKTRTCLDYMKGRGLVQENVEDGVSLWTAV